MTDYRSLLLKILKALPSYEQVNYSVLFSFREGYFTDEEAAVLEEIIAELPDHADFSYPGDFQ